MHERAFGSTGERLPEVGFGAWAIGGADHGNSYGPVDDGESMAAVRRAYELGVRVFDTADAYGFGHSEEILAEALGHDGLIFTKAGFDFYDKERPRWTPEYLTQALKRSLERLDRERVDLFQLHNPPEPMMRDEAVHAFLDLMKEEGLARWVGISVHSLDECLAIVDADGGDSIDAVQLPFSILRQDTLPGVQALSDAGIGVIAREPLANGFLTGKYGPAASFHRQDFRSRWPDRYVRSMADGAQRAIETLGKHGIDDPVGGALAFVLAHEIDVVIPGAKDVGQVEGNVAGAEVVGRLPSACLEDLYVLGDERSAAA